MFSLSPCTHTVISAPDNSESLELSSVLKESFGQPKNAVQYLLPTAREGNVFTGVCPSQLASWLLGHCSSLLRRGRYASYWNAFLVILVILKKSSYMIMYYYGFVTLPDSSKDTI